VNTLLKIKHKQKIEKEVSQNVSNFIEGLERSKNVKAMRIVIDELRKRRLLIKQEDVVKMAISALLKAKESNENLSQQRERRRTGVIINQIQDKY
jgi:hypothetical protein